MNDLITLERIEKMHPSVRKDLKNQYEIINSKLPNDIRLRFSYTLRSIQEQNELYKQGRTNGSRIITNAKGGQSIHNYGLAFDIVLLYDLDKNGTFETAVWTGKYFDKVVKFFKSYGWEWGGDWKRFKDNPHFQLKKLNNESWKWKELINLQKDKEGYPII